MRETKFDIRRLARISAGALLLLLVAVLILQPFSFKAPDALALEVGLARECSLFASPVEGESKTMVRPGLICMIGRVDKAASQAIMEAKVQEGAALVVRSMGGDAKAGLDIADVVLRKHLRVIVDRFCISACANYIFLAADRKIVLPGAWVGFHGTPLSNYRLEWTYIGPPALREQYRKIAEANAAEYNMDIVRRQTALFKAVGINPEITYKFPIGLDPKTFDFQHTFWSYNAQTMRDKFGVKGIEYMEDPEQVGPNAQNLWGLFNSLVCNKVISGAVICRG